MSSSVFSCPVCGILCIAFIYVNEVGKLKHMYSMWLWSLSCSSDDHLSFPRGVYGLGLVSVFQLSHALNLLLVFDFLGNIVCTVCTFVPH